MKLKVIIICAIAIAGMTSSLVIRGRAQAKLRENDAMLRQQDDRVAELTAERQRLSNLVAQASHVPAEDPFAELRKVRTEAEALRRQTNELSRQRRAERPWRLLHSESSTPSNGTSSVVLDVVSD